MQLDVATHVRLALVTWLGLILACAAAGGIGDPLQRRSAGGTADSIPDSFDELIRRPNDEELRLLTFLDSLLRRPPVAAEQRSVTGLLNHPNWQVAGGAYQVLKTHEHTELANIQRRLLERALADSRPADEPLVIVHQQWAKLQLVRGVLQDLKFSSVADRRELLVEVAERSPDGVARARAMEILAVRPPDGWKRMVCAALHDPSERVRLAALEIISQRQWREAVVAVEKLTSSPRPALRRRAIETLEQLGRPANSIEYGDSVMHTALALANRLWQAGMDLQDIISDGPRHDAESVIELLDHHAEDYLDRTVRSNDSRCESQGVLLLAAAARCGRRKLTVRLWEHEVSRADTDEEMLHRGLETLARNRILTGLAAYRRGDKTGALQELTAVAKIAEAAGASASMKVYVSRSGALATAIWQNTVHRSGVDQAFDRRNSIDPVARLVARLLDRLNLTDPDHRSEAYRRIDAWCGLLPPAEPFTTMHRTPLTN